MLKHILVVAFAVLTVMLGAGSAQAVIVANFTDGNGTGSPDSFVGTAGLGWTGAWTGSGTMSTVTTATPLEGAGNPYLSSGGSAAGDRTLRRTYQSFGEVDTGELHMITWKWRFDGNISQFGGAFTDRIHFFGNVSPASGSSASNSWLIGLAAADNGVINDVYEGNWYFFDGTSGSAFNVNNMFDTGLGLIAGQVYEFAVIVDPNGGTYSAEIFDGTTRISASNLGFRNGGTGEFNTLHFGVSASAVNDNLTFALDSIAISVIPEPSTAVLGLMGLGLLGRRRRRD